MMGYLALRDGEFTIRGTDFDGENLILELLLLQPARFLF